MNHKGLAKAFQEAENAWLPYYPRGFVNTTYLVADYTAIARRTTKTLITRGHPRYRVLIL